jgi:hypothetical protein
VTPYRVFLGRKTLGAPHWSIETAAGVQEANDVVIHGRCRTGYRPEHAYPFAMVGTGRITRTDVLGHITVDIWDSEA